MAEVTNTHHFETSAPERSDTYLRDFVRNTQADIAVVEAICRVLSHPNHQRLADKLRELLK